MQRRFFAVDKKTGGEENVTETTFQSLRGPPMEGVSLKWGIPYFMGNKE